MKKFLVISLLFIGILSLSACNLKESKTINGERLGKQETIINGNNDKENIITDTRGMTLYIFKPDSYNKSTCYGKCIHNWPAYYDKNKKGGDWGVIIREDGQKQTTYRGWPLYYFIKDKNPGDKNGDGKLDKWFIAKDNITSASKTIEYTIEDVVKHNKPNDCWTIISNKVYDITSFFGKHPGGDDKLENLCGKDGTNFFLKQHGNNEKAKSKLKSFYKGELKN